MMQEKYTKTICNLDVRYIKETLRLLHAAVNRKEGHGTNTYRRFKRSIKILTENYDHTGGSLSEEYSDEELERMYAEGWS